MDGCEGLHRAMVAWPVHFFDSLGFPTATHQREHRAKAAKHVLENVFSVFVQMIIRADPQIDYR